MLEVVFHGTATVLLALADGSEYVVQVRSLLETGSNPSHHLRDHPVGALASDTELDGEVEEQQGYLWETVGRTMAAVAEQ